MTDRKQQSYNIAREVTKNLHENNNFMDPRKSKSCYQLFTEGVGNKTTKKKKKTSFARSSSK